MQFLEPQTRDFDLDKLIEQFETDQPLYAKLIRTFARLEPQRFRESGVRSFHQRVFSPALRCIGMTLVQDERLPEFILDMVGQPRKAVVALVRKLMLCDPLFDLKMLEVLRAPAAMVKFDNAAIVKVMDILDTVSVNMRLVPIVQQMLKDPDPRIQSKAASFIGRRTHNLPWAQRQVLDTNPRVRANVVEILYGMSSPTAIQIMWNLVEDENNRVAGNALLGLYRLGEVAVLPHIFNMAERPETEFRSTAAWVMGSTGDPRFLQTVASLLQDSERTVRKNALSALQDIKAARGTANETVKLQISVVGFSGDDNSATLTVVVKDGGGKTLKKLSPTSWVLQDSDKVVREYSVDSLDCQNPFCVTFLTADPLQANGQEFGYALDGIRRCLSLRQLEDRWSILKLKPSSTDAATLGEFEVCEETVLHLKQVRKPTVQASVDIPVCFSRSLPEIHSMLTAEALRSRGSAAEAIENGSRKVFDSRHLSGEKQHLICVGPDGLEGLLASAAGIPPDSGVAVHVIALRNHDREVELRAMVESTGGYYIVVQDVAGIPAVCEVLYAALRNRYQLRWQRKSAGPVVLKLYSDFGNAIHCETDDGRLTALNCVTSCAASTGG